MTEQTGSTRYGEALDLPSIAADSGELCRGLIREYGLRGVTPPRDAVLHLTQALYRVRHTESLYHLSWLAFHSLHTLSELTTHDARLRHARREWQAAGMRSMSRRELDPGVEQLRENHETLERRGGWLEQKRANIAELIVMLVRRFEAWRKAEGGAAAAHLAKKEEELRADGWLRAFEMIYSKLLRGYGEPEDGGAELEKITELWNKPASSEQREKLIVRFEDEIKLTDDRIVELVERLKEAELVKEEKQALQTELDQLRQRKSSLEEQLKRVESSQQMLEMEIVRLEHVLDAERAVGLIDEELDRKYEDLHTRYTDLESSATQAESEVMELVAERNDLKQRLFDVEQEFNKREEELNARIAGLEAAAAPGGNGTTAGAQRAAPPGSHSELEDARRETREARAEAGQAQRDAEQAWRDAEEARSRVAQLETELHAVRSRLAQFEASAPPENLGLGEDDIVIADDVRRETGYLPAQRSPSGDEDAAGVLGAAHASDDAAQDAEDARQAAEEAQHDANEAMRAAADARREADEAIEREADLQADNEDLRARIAELEAAGSAVSPGAGDAQTGARIAELEAETGELRARLAEFEEHRSRFETKLIARDTEIETMIRTRDMLSRKVDDFSKLMNERERTITELRRRLDLAGGSGKTDTSAAELHVKIDNLNRKLADRDAAIAELKDRVSSAATGGTRGDAVAAATKERDELRRNVQRLEKDIGRLQTVLDAKTNEAEQLQDRLAEHEASGKSEEMAGLRADLDARSLELEITLQRNAEQEKSIERLNRRLADYEADLVNLRKQAKA